VDRVEVRKDIKNPYDMRSRAEAYMKRVFGAADMDRFLKTMDDYWPDLRMLCFHVASSQSKLRPTFITLRIEF